MLELTSTLGIHACNTGVPILMEELEAAGQLPSRELSERQLAIKADFERNRGYWNSFWDDVLVLDPDFFEAYTQFSSVPWKSGPLEPKVKELIYTAFDVAATHMFAPGLRQHIRNALGVRRHAGGDHGGLRARQHDRRPGVQRSGSRSCSRRAAAASQH